MRSGTCTTTTSLAGIKTIHFARWVPLDGWRRMTFASNYDGAVEAYNDDFINEVWWGLNAAFGNAVGLSADPLAVLGRRKVRGAV